MHIFNFLKNSELWVAPNIFAPLKDQLVHGELLTSSSEEILEVLKKQFQISENVSLSNDSEINTIINMATSILSNHFFLDDATLYLAGIEDSEAIANKYLGGVSGYAWPNAVFIYLNPNRVLPVGLRDV
jgi:hypothetical protein